MTVRLHAELTGPADAPVLVLVNSLGTTVTVWDPLAEVLGDRFRLLRYDLRGHGRSEVPAGPYTVADLGGDLLALLDGYRLDRVSVCGLSIGGMIGLWLAAHAPERVDRLAACCTSAYVGPDVARAYAERAVLVRDRGLEPIADAVVERWFSPGFRDREPDTVARYAAELRATPAEGYAGCCDALVSMDLRPELVAVRAPTLVVVGAADSALPPEHGAAIAAGVPDARLVTVPGAAHLAPAEAPEAVGNALVHHLAG